MSTVRRVFFYILTVITLGILTAGLINLLSLSFDTILARFTLAEIGDVKQQLSLGIAMVVIGGALWFLFWGTIQRHAAKDADESGSSLRPSSSTLFYSSPRLQLSLPLASCWRG